MSYGVDRGAVFHFPIFKISANSHILSKYLKIWAKLIGSFKVKLKT